MHSKLLVPYLATVSLVAASPLNIFCQRTPVVGPTCSKEDSSQLSCHNTAPVNNLCCFNSPGGQILLTQFWNARPDYGPKESWTIHGLWPDNCDGTWEEFCDKSRETSDVTAVLKKFGKTETLEYMNKYWKSNNNDDDGFWQHEWNKHGTCMSTYEPKCYTNYQKDQAIADYMDKTVEIFKGLNTYNILAAAGILPSDTATYTLEALQAAVKRSPHGQEVVFNCKNGSLREVWYHFNVYGSAQSGKYVPAGIVGSPSNCPKTGIKYYPKGGSGTPTSTTKGTTTTGPTSTPTGTITPGEPFSGRGYLTVDKGGCLISAGKWYTKGTCATYTATASDNGFTLKSSKGNCGIVSDEFKCGADVTSTVFIASDGKLANGSSTNYYAAGDANDGSQVGVFTSSDGRQTVLSISWLAI
ncbi:ribonuclease T2-like [Arthrobotrys conoides]|uniref:Ribonuclease T2-like n=1 Tax=Arthrobotrys conoides TaxID=74498 RepID=A0AAN8N4U9_9PEZI